MKLRFLLCFFFACLGTNGIWASDAFTAAQWINTERCQSRSNTWLVYNKTVEISSIPSSLVARIAADSKYWMWINGKLVVFEGGLKRGPERQACYYDEVDIAPYLKSGENMIAVLLWHFGKDGFSHNNSGKAGLLFEAKSGDIAIISDRSWKCQLYEAYQDTDVPHPNYRLPESNIRFDARKELVGWNMPGNKLVTTPAEVIASAGELPFGKLVKRPIPMWKDYGLTDYVTKEVSGNELRCKLPYNAQVTPYLKVEAKAGDTIFIQTDNYLGGGTENVRAEYITRDGIQEYESLGWMNGHEVVYRVSGSAKLLDVKYRETGYDTEFTGTFHCNDEFLNELWKRSARTLYITMRDSYMDCPDRERAQWWGDEVNELGEAFYALSPSGQLLARKGILELIGWQKNDGILFAPCPAGNWDKELPLQMLASVGWYGFYTQYFYSGDSTFVPVIYDGVHRYLHDVWETDADGLPVFRMGAWSWGDWGEHTDMEVLTSCWYYLALKAEREFALQLGKTDDVEEITGMMQKIELAFDRRFWTGKGYRDPNYQGETDDRSQAMAVLSGLASEDKYPTIAAVMKREYHASPYMEKYVLEALFRMGESEFALQRMRERYQKMMSYPYTTLFEGWDIGPGGFGGGTINHAWSGGPLTLLSQKVCGITPLSPGFRTFSVTPQLGDLTEAEACIDTHYGKIEVHIKRTGKRLSVRFTVPEGTKALIPDRKGGLKEYHPGTYAIKI